MTSAAKSRIRPLPINNPSYATRPELWHAVAMQQQRLSELKLPGAARTRRAGHGSGSTAARGISASRLQRVIPTHTASSSADDADDQPLVELTLAQRMGLAEAPEPTLTSKEWAVVAERSRERASARQPCAICLSPFRDEAQVLLSCSHVFHKTCLGSWELFSSSRKCPVCRKNHYQKRATDEGVIVYREQCAVHLQAVWRGVRTRREHGPALRRLNPKRLRSYCERALGRITDRLLVEIDAKSEEVDALFAEIDSSVAASRVVLGVTALDWAEVERRARAHEQRDCPVCLGEMTVGGPLALLACAHLFHERCLASFERFAVGGDCTCPVCRTVYYDEQRTTIALAAEISQQRGLCQPCEPT